MKKIIVVNAGERMFRSAESGGYDAFVETLSANIANFKDPVSGGAIASVEVVKSVEEALRHVLSIDVLVFVTLGMIDEAKRIKKEFPRLKVVVLTGLLSEDEVIVTHKLWLNEGVLLDLVT